MNKQLIEDEKHDNKMNIEELRERMASFIHSEYNGYLFEKDGEAIGYALIQDRTMTYCPPFFTLIVWSFGCMVIWGQIVSGSSFEEYRIAYYINNWGMKNGMGI